MRDLVAVTDDRFADAELVNFGLSDFVTVSDDRFADEEPVNFGFDRAYKSPGPLLPPFHARTAAICSCSPVEFRKSKSAIDEPTPGAEGPGAVIRGGADGPGDIPGPDGAPDIEGAPDGDGEGFDGPPGFDGPCIMSPGNAYRR